MTEQEKRQVEQLKNDRAEMSLKRDMLESRVKNLDENIALIDDRIDQIEMKGYE